MFCCNFSLYSLMMCVIPMAIQYIYPLSKSLETINNTVTKPSNNTEANN